jgi:hypothetical protein
MGSKLAAVALLLLAGTASAQQPTGTMPYPAWNPSATAVPLSAPPAPLPASLDGPATNKPMPRPAEFVPTSSIQRTQMVQAAPYKPDDIPDLLIPTEPPGLERLRQLNSEAQLFERWRQELRARREPATFPDEPILAREAYLGRSWPQRTCTAEPNYVSYERLFFEEKNSERYGWDLGPISPIVSTAYFFKDVALFPYHAMTEPCRRFDSSAGQCLPGDPVAYKLYPEGLSATGALGEAAAIVTLLAIFP